MAILVSTSNDPDENSTISNAKEPAKVPGSAGTLAGGSMAGRLARHAIESPPGDPALPPITNRGADITAPTENRSLVDWVAFTFKTTDPQEVASSIGIDPDLFTRCTFGFSGYRKSLKLGNISIYFDGREEMGCHVEMSGQGCRQFEGLFHHSPWESLFTSVLANGGKFTRLDLAIDNVDGGLSLDLLSAAIQDHDHCVRTKFGEWRRIQKGSFQNGQEITGDTIYLGSSKSHTMFRIYDKAMESGTTGQWVRFEIQLRDSRSHEAAKLFAADTPLGYLAIGIINTYFAIIENDDSNTSRCTLQVWWAEWLQNTEKIKLTTDKEIKLVTDTMEFIKRQYAPSFAMINQHLGKASFNEFLDGVLDDGRERMGAKHEKILAASRTGKRRAKA
jgi:phage replication initiation protein